MLKGLFVKRFRTINSVLLICWGIVSAGISFAQDKQVPSKIEDGDQIRISANTLMVDSDANMAEFSGNVQAIQGQTIITSDSLQIYYKSTKASDGKSAGPNQDAIEKIIAKGRVTIRLDDKTAEADQAVYTTEDKILTLSGDRSRITSGKDSITGAKIIFNRANGKIKVESGTKPVEAIIYSGPKGIQ